MESIEVKTEPCDELFIPEIDIIEADEKIKQEILTSESEIDIEERAIKVELREDLLDCLSNLPGYLNICNDDVKLPLDSKWCQVVVKKLLECDSCSFCTNKKTELVTHMRHHHTPNTSDWITSTNKSAPESRMRFGLRCDECGYRYTHPAMLAWHIEHCHGSNPIINVINIENKKCFQCVYCKSEYREFNLMIRHLRCKHKLVNLPHHCHVCKKQFICYVELRTHQYNGCKKEHVGRPAHVKHSHHSNMRNTGSSDFTHHPSDKHRIPKILKCNLCGMKFAQSQMLTWHIENCHGTNPILKVIRFSGQKYSFLCVQCKSEINGQRTIVLHLRDKHNLENLPFRCNICSQQYTRWEHLKRHRCMCQNGMRVKVLKLKCDRCCVLFGEPELLAWHTEHCHGANPIVKVVKLHDKKYGFQCVQCDTVYKYQHLIIPHLRAQHQLVKLPFHCKACDKQFVLKSVLNYHQFLCKKKKVDDSLSHVRHDEHSSHLPIQSSNELACVKCNKIFKSQSNLEKHISSFHANQKYNCAHCGQSFTFFSKLKSHCQNRHPGKYFLKCSICNAEFNSDGGYLIHNKYRHKGLVFPCNTCSATFWNPSALKTHINSVHSKLGKLSCKLCSAKFKCKVYLQKHVERMHSGRILHCEHCSYSTRSKSHLIRHLRRQHF